MTQRITRTPEQLAALERSLFTVDGHPKEALQNAMARFKVTDLAGLKRGVATRRIRLPSFMLLRSMGSIYAPSPCAQVLFGLPSRAERIRRREAVAS